MSLAITLFGPIRVDVDGQPLLHLHNRKTLWLLALLVLRAGRPVEREWLAGTLWPDVEPDRSLGNLRPVLSALRGALGGECERLQTPSRHTVSLDLTGADVDVRTFDAHIANKTLPALTLAVELYKGPLLEGCAEEWVPQERRAREQECLHALHTLAEAAQAEGECHKAAHFHSRAVDIDPWREENRRGLMRSLHAAGDTNAALQVYRDFAQLLSRDAQSIPDRETRALYDNIRSDAKRRATDPHPAPETTAASRTAPVVRGHLPHPLTELIGREDERLDVAAKLRQSRLVTLTGPGGIGKTRLSVEVTTQVVSWFPDGAYLVPLEALGDGTQIPSQIAAVLQRKEEPGQPVLESLVQHLRHKKLLLLLDNCEHLVAACAPVAAHLLRECPGLRILATSREPLMIPGETLWAVPALTAPDPVHLPTRRATLLRVLMGYESVRLFVERAQAVQQSFELTAANALPVAQICARLQGLPLAIELAAARVNVLTAPQIAARLDDHLSLLTGGSKVAPLRHQTLRAALDWSHDLLNEPERTLLARLSVFAGGWTLDAAEDVCSGNDLPIPQVLDLLSSLVNKSLVVFEPPIERENTAFPAVPEPSARYRLLETVRQYAAERLSSAGETEHIRLRHRNCFLALAEEAAQHRKGGVLEPWLRRLEIEQDNFRASLAWDGPDPADAVAGLRLAGALGSFWNVRGHFREGREHLRRALGRADAQEATLVRARALNSAGMLAHNLGDSAEARALHDAALVLFRASGDRPGIASTLTYLGNASDSAPQRLLYAESLAIYRELEDTHGIAASLANVAYSSRVLGNHSEAQSLLEESLRLFRTLDDKQGMGSALGSLGNIAFQMGEDAAARELLEEALGIHREFGNRKSIAWALSVLGGLATTRGEFDSAQAQLEECLRLRREIEDKAGEAWTLLHLGGLANARIHFSEARALFEEGLGLFRTLDDNSGRAWSLSHLGRLAAVTGDMAAARARLTECLPLFQNLGNTEGLAASLSAFAVLFVGSAPSKAARLWGATQSLGKDIGAATLQEMFAEYDAHISRARVALGDDGFTRAWNDGAGLTAEEAVACALDE